MGMRTLFAHLNPGARKPKPGANKPAKAAKPPAKGARRRAEEAVEDDDTEEEEDTGAVEDDDEAAVEDDDEAAEEGAGDDDEKDGAAEDDEEVSAQAEAEIRRSAVKAERQRCAAIFADPAAANNVAQACELAFGTGLSAKRVVSILKQATPAAKGGGLSAAMRGVRVPQLGNGDDGGKGDDDDANKALTAAINQQIKNRGGAK